MLVSDKDFLVKLGRTIAERRKTMGYSQADLASRVNMEVPNLSVIENGKSNPQVLTLLKIASALHCNLPELLPLFEKPDMFLDGQTIYTPRKHKKNSAKKDSRSTGEEP